MTFRKLSKELPPAKQMEYDINTGVSSDVGPKVFTDEKDREQFICKPQRSYHQIRY